MRRWSSPCAEMSPPAPSSRNSAYPRGRSRSIPRKTSEPIHRSGASRYERRGWSNTSSHENGTLNEGASEMADAYGLGVDEGQDRPPRGRRRREDLPDPAVRRGPVFGRIHHHDRDEGLEAELEPRPSRGRGRDGDADLGRPRTEG